MSLGLAYCRGAVDDAGECMLYDRLELGECAYVLADTGDTAPSAGPVSGRKGELASIAPLLELGECMEEVEGA